MRVLPGTPSGAGADAPPASEPAAATVNGNNATPVKTSLPYKKHSHADFNQLSPSMQNRFTLCVILVVWSSTFLCLHPS